MKSDLHRYWTEEEERLKIEETLKLTKVNDLLIEYRLYQQRFKSRIAIANKDLNTIRNKIDEAKEKQDKYKGE